MLRKVKLYGELADFVGHKELEAVINSTADAIKFLITNFDGLEAHMADRHYKVLVDKSEIAEDEIQYPIGKSSVSIVPVITGAGGNTSRILLGGALIGASFLFPGAGMFGTFGSGGVAAAGSTLTQAQIAAGLTVGGKVMTGIGSLTSAIGASLVLQGVSNMLFPLPGMPDFSNEEDPRISFSFSGVQNTSRAGTSHPIVYGEIITGSVVISAGVDTNQVAA